MIMASLPVIFFMSIYIQVIWCKKILLIPAGSYSHVIEQVIVGNTLIEKGHNVHILLGSDFERTEDVTKSGIQPIIYPVAAEDLTYGRLQQLPGDFFNGNYSLENFMRVAIGVLKDDCRRILLDQDLMSALHTERYDLAITDGYFLGQCLFFIPHNLSVPYVFMFSCFSDLQIGIPSLPSFAVSVLALFSPEMTLWQKMENFLHLMVIHSIPDYTDEPNLRQQFAPGETSLLNIVQRSELYVSTRDHILEWPLPSLPNTIRVPGITTGEINQIPPHINDIINAAKAVAVVSFGSTVHRFPQDIFFKLTTAFGKMPEMTFLFRVSSQIIEKWSDDIPSNIKLLPWLPQQEIISHNKTRLFVTHCGNNGQYESAYHGVPMVGFPLFGDQPHNCARMREHGIGEYLDIRDFTAEQLVDTMQKVLTDPSYTKNTKEKSLILKHQPLPKHTVANSIEYVMKFGGEHLRSQSQKISMYQLLMLDVAIAILVVIIAALAMTTCLIKGILKRLKDSWIKHKLD